MPEKIEKIMKRFHVFFSNCDLEDSNADRMIVPRKPMLNLLKELNTAVYEIMEQYEVTQKEREREIKRQKQKAEEIIKDADKTAEEIYASSMIYTDRILIEVRDMIEQADRNLRDEYDCLSGRLAKQIEMVMGNQNDLRDHLSKTKQNEKYKNIIKEYNDRIEQLHKKEALEKEKERRKDNTENIEKSEDEESEDIKEIIIDKDRVETDIKTDTERNIETDKKIETDTKTDTERTIETDKKIEAENKIEVNITDKPEEKTQEKMDKFVRNPSISEWKDGVKRGSKETSNKSIKGNNDRDNRKKYNLSFDIDDDIETIFIDEDAYSNNAEKEVKETANPIKKVASVVDASALSDSLQEDTVKKVAYEIKVNPMYFQAVGEFSAESLDAEYEQWMNNGEEEILDEIGASKTGSKQIGSILPRKKNKGKNNNKKNAFMKRIKR